MAIAAVAANHRLPRILVNTLHPSPGTDSVGPRCRTWTSAAGQRSPERFPSWRSATECGCEHGSPHRVSDRLAKPMTAPPRTDRRRLSSSVIPTLRRTARLAAASRLQPRQVDHLRHPPGEPGFDSGPVTVARQKAATSAAVFNDDGWTGPQADATARGVHDRSAASSAAGRCRTTTISLVHCGDCTRFGSGPISVVGPLVEEGSVA